VKMCFTLGNFNIAPGFAGCHLAVGAARAS
jgi:hypothetical protein